MPSPAQPAVRLPLPPALLHGAGDRCAREEPPLREITPGTGRPATSPSSSSARQGVDARRVARSRARRHAGYLARRLVTRPSVRPLVLCVLDGFGLAPARPHNAITLADTPHWDRWWAASPQTTLSASGEDVGLPARPWATPRSGTSTSAPAHRRTSDRRASRRAIRDGSFYENPALSQRVRRTRRAPAAGRCI